jgi:hypothetical protein
MQSVLLIVSVSTVALFRTRPGSARNLEHLEHLDEIRQAELQGETGSEWPADAGFQRLEAAMAAALLIEWCACV